MRIFRTAGLGLALAAAVACVTVNVYFPAAKVEKTAEEIVGDVYGTNDTSRGGRSSLEVFLAAASGLLGPAVAEAQDGQVTSVANASIRALKEQIAAHHQQLAPFYDQGNVGITGRGYLEVRSTDGLAVPQVAQLRRLVESDNQARKQLYAEVAKALGIDSSQVGNVETIFAEEWQGKAGSGWWVERGGTWARK
jgi:uncharacterized protein YdbL (DUF1318 family)